jgi:phosphohistidine phosphatase
VLEFTVGRAAKGLGCACGAVAPFAAGPSVITKLEAAPASVHRNRDLGRVRIWRRRRDRSDRGGRRTGRGRLRSGGHGPAIDRDDPDCPAESERFLTPKGIERTREAAIGLAEMNIAPAVLLTSPYVRAVQTGEIVCEVLGIDPKTLHATDSLKPEAKPSRIAEELGRVPFAEAICFGHAPHLDDFIAYALQAAGPITTLKKAGVACLDLESLSPTAAHLRWLLTPKLLRDLGD